MRSLPQVLAVAGVGLDGDRYATGRGYYSNDPEPGREITLIEIEVLEALASEHDLHLAPAESRRNITTRGIRLDPLVGRRFLVGEVLCEGKRLCEPCEHLAELTGKAVVKPLVHRGGLRAAIVEGGIIRVGDAVRRVAVSAPDERPAS
ncbi:MAG: MOSC domain-containing protein [Chloroflexi bacterium]|nr:MOSC domain-containing protein [Chloroflexota bacterium]